MKAINSNAEKCFPDAFLFSSCFLMFPVHNLVQGLIYWIINLYNNPILANKTKATKHGIRKI